MMVLSSPLNEAHTPKIVLIKDSNGQHSSPSRQRQKQETFTKPSKIAGTKGITHQSQSSSQKLFFHTKASSEAYQSNPRHPYMQS